MIRGIGTDIIEIKRVELAISRHGSRFLDRIFTAKEQDYCLTHRQSSQHFAGRFAAKEAIVKSLGTGFRKGISWLDIEIINNTNGKPEVILSPKLEALLLTSQEEISIQLSISHCREYTTAFAIFTTQKNTRTGY